MFVCPECGREFRRRIFLSLHKNYTHNRCKAQCKLGGKVFHLHSQLHQHVRSHGFSRLRHFSRKWGSSYFRHRAFRRINCSATFLKPTQLSAHMFQVHGQVQKNRQIPVQTYSTAMLSTIDKLPVSSCVNSGKADFLSDSQDSYAESPHSYEMSSNLGEDRSSSPTFGAKSTTRYPKRTMCVHDSPNKSPSRLARERLLRKYQRPHVSSPASRKLFVDKKASENNRVPNLRKRNRGSNDPKMPRLTEISILLERVDYHTNSSVLLRKDKVFVPKNQIVVKKKVKLEEVIELKRSDSSGSENRMPHLHRFSSEEKATDYVDGETWNDNESPTSICVDKFDGFKQREGLFDILQHEHEKTSPPYNKKKSNSAEKILKPTNGLVLKKPTFLDVNISPTNQSEFPVSETNGSSKKSHKSDKISSDTDAILDGTSEAQTKSHPENRSEQLSAEEKLLILPSKSCDHSHSELSIISSVQPHVPLLKYSPPLCHTERANGSVSSHSPTLRPKKHHAEAISFMSDLSELKQEREDQAESYPNSLSSVDDGPDPITLMVQNLHNHFVNRQLSCPVPANEDVQIKRNRHMTVSGRTSDLHGQSPAKARERRRRTKTLSHGCSCCMDLGPSRKKRRRFSRSNAKAIWSIPHELTEEQHTFVDSSTKLISLRHKVFRLCQVLFPKLSPVWQLNADTEQVDMLVNEISGIIKSLKENKSSVQTSKLCPDHSDLKRSPDLSPNHLSLVKPSKQKIDNIFEELVSHNENESLFSDSRLEDGSLCADSSEKSELLPVLDCEMPTDNPDLSVQVPGELSTSGNINTPFTTEASQTDILNCSVSIERTVDAKLSPLDSCGNLKQVIEPCSSGKQTSLEDIELCSSDNQEIISAVQSSCSSKCESPQNMNNSNSQSDVPLTSPSGSMWGSGSNNQWEHEFFQYLSKSTALNKPKTLLTSKPFRKESNSLTDGTGKTFSCDVGTSTQPDPECEPITVLPKLLDLKVELCKDPKVCLTQLRWKVIRLLQPLLPNLTLENNFDKFSDDVDMLVDLVTQSNERKLSYKP